MASDLRSRKGIISYDPVIRGLEERYVIDREDAHMFALDTVANLYKLQKVEREITENFNQLKRFTEHKFSELSKKDYERQQENKEIMAKLEKWEQFGTQLITLLEDHPVWGMDTIKQFREEYPQYDTPDVVMNMLKIRLGINALLE